MNDFTKEELENILNGNIEIYPHSHMDLRNKIQSMIDNYCDHQFLLKGKGAQVYTQCEKCGYRLFKDE